LANRHLWFDRDAIEACVDASDGDRALHYADALDAFVSGEPLPWALLISERGRALVDHARGGDKPAAALRLQQVRDATAAAGLNWALEAIDAALGSA
jgi:hypothetical protein